MCTRSALFLAIAIGITPARAQGPAQIPAEPRTTKVFQIKYADLDALSRILSTGGAQIQVSRELRAISVSAPNPVMATVEDAIRRLDVPGSGPKNIDLTVYVLAAGEIGPSSIPPELQDVAKQLRGIFTYKSFRLLDTLLLRCRAGQRAEASGVVTPLSDKASPEEPRTVYQFHISGAAVSPDEKGRLIRIDGLRFNMKVPAPTATFAGQKQFSFLDVGIITEVDIREGQKVVVGKANINGSEQASILVVQAKVVD